MPSTATPMSSDTAPPLRPRRRSRAKPKPPRERVVVTIELRGLGGVVLEQALLDPDAEPQDSLVAWADHLAAELDVEGVGSPRSYRELMQGLVAINRRADADPERPLIALPPAIAV